MKDDNCVPWMWLYSSTSGMPHRGLLITSRVSESSTPVALSPKNICMSFTLEVKSGRLCFRLYGCSTAEGIPASRFEIHIRVHIALKSGVNELLLRYSLNAKVEGCIPFVDGLLICSRHDSRMHILTVASIKLYIIFIHNFYTNTLG